MAARANSLTDRATAAAARHDGRWSMPAADARAFIRAMAALGYDAGSLFQAAGVADEDLRDPDARVSCDALGSAIQAAQNERYTPNLALAVAAHTPLGAYPLLDYLVLTSDTIATGVQRLAHYVRLVGAPVTVVVHDRERPVRVEIVATPSPFSAEYFVGLTMRHLRAQTEGRFSAVIHFRHALDDLDAWARTVHCAVHAPSAWSGFAIEQDGWQLPLTKRDPVLHTYLESVADATLAQLPAREGSAAAVQRILARRVAGHDTRIEAVAKALAISTRTLQRRLAAEGISYQALLEDARKGAAARHLADSALSIAEIAYLAGYSEPAPFHRAFRRWYGTTPESFRRGSRTTGR